ncbi:MAG: DUF4386 domain-containing protein [Cytophagales bacterium]|uniref:DUF4386 domain-containing protein n=1 Tax=Algoriphagus taiwanensis TaxID=1445656 RepID=A0ABQ6Q1P5_9BACT|nr:MAG: DUF4386 domain-containing protein [Cytophagales bacterium]GMQ34106.1 hypothetical protein Ataiwa_23780 [Algoriphagus taiwanensis]
MNLSKRKYAIIAGLSLILMAVLAGYAYGFVYGSLVFPGEGQKTLESIQSSIETFQSGIAAWIGIFILDILVAWALHLFLKNVNLHLSQVTAALRILYAAVLGVAIYHQMAALSMVSKEAASSQILYELEAFEIIWSAGLIFFGLHLIGLGVLCWKAGFVPNFWGGILIFAGFCYSGIHLAKALFSEQIHQIVQVEQVLSLPMAFAEIGLAIWLIWKGGRIPSHIKNLSQ